MVLDTGTSTRGMLRPSQRPTPTPTPMLIHTTTTTTTTHPPTDTVMVMDSATTPGLTMVLDTGTSTRGMLRPSQRPTPTLRLIPTTTTATTTATHTVMDTGTPHTTMVD